MGSRTFWSGDWSREDLYVVSGTNNNVLGSGLACQELHPFAWPCFQGSSVNGDKWHSLVKQSDLKVLVHNHCIKRNFEVNLCTSLYYQYIHTIGSFSTMLMKNWSKCWLNYFVTFLDGSSPQLKFTKTILRGSLMHVLIFYLFNFHFTLDSIEASSSD